MALTTPTKFLVVISGYIVAALVAYASLQLNIAETPAIDAANAASSGMSAFGDAVLWLGVFAVASVPATAAAVFFVLQTRAK
jgi:hypothetical protein